MLSVVIEAILIHILIIIGMVVVMVMVVNVLLIHKNIRIVFRASSTVVSTNGIAVIGRATAGIVRVGRNDLL